MYYQCVLKPESEILAYWQGEEGTKVLQNLTVLYFLLADMPSLKLPDSVK